MITDWQDLWYTFGPMLIGPIIILIAIEMALSWLAFAVAGGFGGEDNEE